MNVIYEAKGRAAEFSHLALNLYKGRCEHECTYCYCPKVLRISHEQWLLQEPEPRSGIIKALREQAPKFAGTDKRVLLCFLNDPYSPIAVKTGITRKALFILRSFDIPFQVLTKAGITSRIDFGLYSSRDAYAVTLTFLDEDQSIHYEPYAANPLERVMVLQAAHEMGIETWVSLEPVIDPAESLRIIEQTYKFVDLYKIGMLNHQQPPQPIDWRAFGMEAIGLCRRYGKPFFIKSDLAKYLNGVSYKNTDNRKANWRQ